MTKKKIKVYNYKEGELVVHQTSTSEKEVLTMDPAETKPPTIVIVEGGEVLTTGEEPDVGV